MLQELIKIKTSPDQHLALWKVFSERSQSNKNIFLTHGTFSNKKVCLSIADLMINNGYTCWIMEWRNHGASSHTKVPFNFETIGKEDIKTTLDYLQDKLSIGKLACITHSGGGIALSIALICYPELKSRIESIAMFGCQAFGAAHTSLNFIKIWFGKQTSKMIGRVPASKTGSEHDETYHTMKQWFDWNLSKKFLSDDGTDYLPKMASIKIPIFSIAGAGDTFIAPPSACESFLKAFDNPDNKFLICSKELGFQEDYNHPRILHSRNASVEIHPLVLEWIERNEA